MAGHTLFCNSAGQNAAVWKAAGASLLFSVCAGKVVPHTLLTPTPPCKRRYDLWFRWTCAWLHWNDGVGNARGVVKEIKAALAGPPSERCDYSGGQVLESQVVYSLSFEVTNSVSDQDSPSVRIQVCPVFEVCHQGILVRRLSSEHQSSSSSTLFLEVSLLPRPGLSLSCCEPATRTSSEQWCRLCWGDPGWPQLLSLTLVCI